MDIHLGIKDSGIKDIKALTHFQPAQSRKDMLVTWLKSGRANSEDFIQALKAIIGQLRIIQEILSQNGNTCNASGAESLSQNFHINHRLRYPSFFNYQTI